MEEEVTDTEWFFLGSFVDGASLPGQVLYSESPTWITGANLLAMGPCDRPRQAQAFGLQTMVCIPVGSGVLELRSTDLIYQRLELMNKIKVLFNFNSLEIPSGSWLLAPTACGGAGLGRPGGDRSFGTLARRSIHGRDQGLHPP